MSKLRIGLIGAGLLGLTHSVSLSFLANEGILDIELASVYDPDTPKARSLVDNIGFKALANSPGEVISSDEIDVVYITTPTVFHRDYVIQAAGEKKAVFCEKPLYIDLKGAKEMAKAIRDAGVLGGVGLVLRFSPTYNFIQDKIAEFDTGYPILISIRDDQCLPIRGLHDTGWRVDITKSGGGTIIEHSIHDIDIFTQFFGRPTIIDAELKYLTKREGIEDYARVVMKFDRSKDGGGGDVEGILTSIWHDMITRPSNRRLEVIFERLFIATDHDFIGPVQYTFADETKTTIDSAQVLTHFVSSLAIDDTPTEEFFMKLDYETLGPYILEDYFFIRALMNGEEYSPNFDEAVAAHELVDEIYGLTEKTKKEG